MKTIEEIIAEIEAKRTSAAEAADEERTILAAAMMSVGVNRATINFAGGGDSGSIDDVELEMRPGMKPPEDLEKKLIDWADVYLEGCNVDWYNNEGGQGTITFDLTGGLPQFRCNIDVNIMTSETAYEVEEVA